MGVADPADGWRVATLRRLQDRRPRSVFEVGGPGSSLALTAAESVQNRTLFLLKFSVRLPSVGGDGAVEAEGSMSRR